MRKNSKYVFPGFVYTITCTDYVDLGQTIDDKKILWKTTNETGKKEDSGTQHNKNKKGYTDEWYYDWATACKFGTSTEVATDRLPTKNELTALSNIKKSPQSGEEYSFANGGATFKTSYGSVFFPAAGHSGGELAGNYGSYWSGEPDVNKACYLAFGSPSATVGSYDVSYGFSVRLVRGL